MSAAVRTVHVNRTPISSAVKASPPPIPVRRIHSLPDRTISEQSQLDDILVDLLNDPLFVDGSKTFEFSNEADGTYGTISANHGSITTAHSPRRGRQQLHGGLAQSPSGGGGTAVMTGGVGGGRTVVSWQTNQTGPKRTVAMSRQTFDRPTANSSVEITESRRVDTESGTRPGSGRGVQNGVGSFSSTNVGGRSSSMETRRIETRTETTSKRDGPPSPPVRRRLVSAPESTPPLGNSASGSRTSHHVTTGSSSSRRQQRNLTDVVHSDTEDYFRSAGGDNRWPKPSYDDPYMSDDMAPYFNQAQYNSSPSRSSAGYGNRAGRSSTIQPRARTFDLESPSPNTVMYETKRSFFVSGIERPANTSRQTKYTFCVSPQRSLVDDDWDATSQGRGVNKPPAVPPPPRDMSPVLPPFPVLPPLRSDSSREAVRRVQATHTVTSTRVTNGGSRSPSLDDLERSLQSVQLLLDTQQSGIKHPSEAAPVDENTLTRQRQAGQHHQPATPPAAQVEIEEEFISLRPIGPGVQNLEPEDPARFRSMTPAFPTQQRVVSPYPWTPPGGSQVHPVTGFPGATPSDVRPIVDISPQTPMLPFPASFSASAPPTATSTVTTAATISSNSAAKDLDEFAALLDFDSIPTPQKQQPQQSAPAQRPDQLQPQLVQRNLASPPASLNANTGLVTAELSPTSSDVIYQTPRRVVDYGAVTSSGTSTLQQQQTPVASGYVGIVDSQTWLQQKQFQQQQMHQSPQLYGQQQNSAQAVAYQSQQSPVSSSLNYSASAGFHGEPGIAVQKQTFQQQQLQQKSSSASAGFPQFVQQHPQPEVKSSGFGQQQQHEIVQRQQVGHQQSGPKQFNQGANQNGNTQQPHIEELVHREVKTVVQSEPLDTWSTWSPGSQPIVVQDFSSYPSSTEQTSTLTRGRDGNVQDASESTLSRNTVQRQQSAGGMLTVTTSAETSRTLSAAERGRSMSPSDMALRARLQSRHETKSPGLVGPSGGTTSPSIYAGHSRTNSLTSLNDGSEVLHNTPRFVRDTSKYWHKPHITREEAISLLRDKTPGSFVVRNSNTFQGAFGLALKVAQLPPNIHTKEGVDPQSELVRHFLIEPTSKGVRLKGCSNEPVFGSLAALIYQHTITPMALPCKLVLPEVDIADMDAVDASSTGTLVKNQLYQQGAACNVLYVGSVDMESLTGPEALSRAITKTFPTGSQVTPPSTTVVHFKVSSQGITLTDNKHKLFFRRHYPINTVTFCGVDARDRRWTLKLDDNQTIDCKVFGFVARKSNSNTENACHVFAEMDPNQPANAIVNFLTKIMIGQGHFMKT